MLTIDARRIIRDPVRKRTYNQKLFGAVALEYDIATRCLSLGGDQRWKAALIRHLPVGPVTGCVDLACGTGDVTFRLADHYPGARITGIDVTPQMLEVARRRDVLGRVHFIEADMGETGLPEGCADVVTGAYALRNAARF